MAQLDAPPPAPARPEPTPAVREPAATALIPSTGGRKDRTPPHKGATSEAASAPPKKTRGAGAFAAALVTAGDTADTYAVRAQRAASFGYEDEAALWRRASANALPPGTRVMKGRGGTSNLLPPPNR